MRFHLSVPKSHRPHKKTKSGLLFSSNGILFRDQKYNRASERRGNTASILKIFFKSNEF